MIITKGQVSTLDEYLKWVKQIEENIKNYNRQAGVGYKFHLYFRGISDLSYTDCPSIYRDHGLIKKENIIFNECISNLPDEFINEKTTFDKLVKLQHYGLPTRLLDITKNPLTALYFATKASRKNPPSPKDITEKIESMDIDALKKYVIELISDNTAGAVIAYYVSEQALKYSDSDTVAAVANITKRPFKQWNSNYTSYMYDEFIKEPTGRKHKLKGQEEKVSNEEYYISTFNDSESVAYLLHDIRAEKPHYYPIIRREHLESIWCVIPKKNNKRIARQDGAFLLYGTLCTKANFLRVPDISFVEIFLNIFATLYSLAYNDIPYHADHPDIKSTENFLMQHHEWLEWYNEFKESLNSLDGKERYCYSAESTLAYNKLLNHIYVYCKIENKRLISEITTITDKLEYVYEDNFIVDYELSDFWLLSDKLDELAIKIANNNFICSLIKGDGLIFRHATTIENKKNLSQEIKTLGASQEYLFPDLDKIADSLIEEYSCNFIPPSRK